MGDRFAHQAKAQLQACIEARARRRRSYSGLEQIEPRTQHHRLGAVADPRGCGCGREGAGLEESLLLRCRPHQPAPRSTAFSRPAISTPSMSPTSSASLLDSGRIENFVKRRSGLVGHAPPRRSGRSPSRSRRDLLRRRRRSSSPPWKKPAKSTATLKPRRAREISSPKFRWTRPTRAQTPAELLIILAAIADEGIPVQTIAPKFTGRFNKGVDYVGNVAQFRREMALDVAAIAWAISQFRPAEESQAQHSLRQRQVFHLSRDLRDHEELRRASRRPPAPRGSKSSSASPKQAATASRSRKKFTPKRTTIAKNSALRTPP